MKTPPKLLYLERWPEDSGHDEDLIHYTQTGYGIDESGHTSHIYVYRRLTARELAALDEPKKERRR